MTRHEATPVHGGASACRPPSALKENRATVDAMLARLQGGVDGAGPRGGRPPQVMRAIENLKLAMRMRLSREALTPEQANAFAALLDHTAQQLEQL